MGTFEGKVGLLAEEMLMEQRGHSTTSQATFPIWGAVRLGVSPSTHVFFHKKDQNSGYMKELSFIQVSTLGNQKDTDGNQRGKANISEGAPTSHHVCIW
jgi:hypothetical protein